MAERRLRILFVGHACAPHLGSEPGLTWNWAWHLAEHHEVCVIAHPQYRIAVESVCDEHGARAPRIVWVRLPRHLEPWQPSRGERGIHLHYLFWQRMAFREAVRLHASRRFDIVHHVSWGTVNAAPQLWRLSAPFVWGPLGGGQAAPLRFHRCLGRRGLLTEAARSVRTRFAPLLPSLRLAATESALILATNHETAAVLHRAGARNVELFLDNGVLPEQFIERRRVRGEGDALELLWVGRLEPRKALLLALQALARVPTHTIRLRIAGDGPLRMRCQREADSLGLGDRVRFLGRVAPEQVRELYAASDALLFTSLQDGFGSVVIDAMAAGLPILGLDHQGFGALIPERAAIKVPVTSPAATVDGLAQGIGALAASPDLARRIGEAARRHAETETWNQRARRMNRFYEHCLTSSRDCTWVAQGGPAALSTS